MGLFEKNLAAGFASNLVHPVVGFEFLGQGEKLFQSSSGNFVDVVLEFEAVSGMDFDASGVTAKMLLGPAKSGK